ncbi:hypothetical protein PWT90_03351 [Aphanocladium album]|nr:hypothetical protein PWT90_03351 [Aphanocladium album]
MDYITRVFAYTPPDGVADLPMLVDADRPGRQLLRADYKSIVKRIAVGLQSHGVGDQDCVGLLSHNDLYYYVLGDGVIAAGGIYAGIPTFVKQAELETAIKAAGVKWLFVAPEFLDLALATVKDMGMSTDTVLVYDPPGLDAYSGTQASLSKLIGGADEGSFRNANEGKDQAAREAFRLFTSGSTGSVKAAVVSHEAQVNRLDAGSASVMPLGQFLLMIGMYHVSGLMMHGRACTTGFTVCITRSTDATSIIDRIQTMEITSTMVSPRLMETMVAQLGDEHDPLASLRLVVFAGSPSRQETVDSFRKILPVEARLHTAYGLTEVSGVSSIAVDDEWTTGRVGTIIPTTACKIVDPDTLQEVSPGTAGEVCARNNGMFSSYHNNAEATASAFLPGGWFRTGDKGVFDAGSGVLTLLGRFKEIFKVRYEEVAPAEVEDVLLQNGDVCDVVVTSTPARDDDKDRECMAYVVPRADAQLTAQAVVDFVAARLAAHKVPTGGVVFCDRIPRGAMGKPLKDELLKVASLPESARFLTVRV